MANYTLDPQILRSLSQLSDEDLQKFCLTGRGISLGYRVGFDWKHTVFRAELLRDGKVVRRYESQAGLDLTHPLAPVICPAPLLLLDGLTCARMEFRSYIDGEHPHA